MLSGKIQKNKKYHDEWRLHGHTLTRLHNVPRPCRFVPSECDDCPVDLSKLADDRITEQFYKSRKDNTHDSWRFRDNSNKQSEQWIGSATFRVVTDDTETTLDKRATELSSREGITMRVQAWG